MVGRWPALVGFHWARHSIALHDRLTPASIKHVIVLRMKRGMDKRPHQDLELRKGNNLLEVMGG